MATPQLEDGYTAIANELMEQFPRLWTILKSIYDMPVLLTLIRKTYGYHKKSDKISISQFSQTTGINHRLICKSLTNLLKANIIVKTRNGYVTEYGLQKDYSKWVGYQYSLNSDSQNNVPQNSVPENTVPTISVSQNTVRSNSVSQDSVLQNSALQNSVLQDTQTVSHETLPSVPQDTTPCLQTVSHETHTKDTKDNITKDTIKIEYIQHIKLDDEFFVYYENLRPKYSTLDYDTELILCKEWWEKKTKKIMKSPKLAWRNWLENSLKYKQENKGNGHKSLTDNDEYVEGIIVDNGLGKDIHV